MSLSSQKKNNNSNIFISNTKQNNKDYKELKKIAMNNIYKRYGNKSKLKYKYLGLIMENLIFNKNTHLVSTFKDYMIWDYIEEFLKRFYNEFESCERVPKFATFYKNYLKFFCVPTFKDNYCNEMIHNYSEKKAELFYNANYRKKKQNDSEQTDFGLCEESESDEESDSKISKNLEKTIFNQTVKKKIEKYSPINTSIVLPESEAKLKPDDSGLLITSSNESSLYNIMNGMTLPQKKTKKNKNVENIKNTNSNRNKNEKNNSLNNNKNNNNLNNNNDNKINNIDNKNINKLNINNNNTINNNNQGKIPSSYRSSQKNLISSTLKKFNNQTIETLLSSQTKIRNISSGYLKKDKNNNIYIKDNPLSSSINNLIKSQLNNKNINSNNNKIISYMGIYKKKSIPKSRNENKLPEEIIKSQTKINNFQININNNNNNNNNNPGIINIKKSNNSKNITSINNYKINYKQGLQKSRNQQQSLSINSNTYTKNSFDKINNIKKNINANLIKNNNIEFILNQLKIHPFITLKKSPTKRASYSNSNNNNQEDKKSKKTKTLSADYRQNQGLGKYLGKNRINNNKNNNIRPYSEKYENSPSIIEFMKKSAFKLVKSNLNIKSNNSKDLKIYKKSTRNFSYNKSQKSDFDYKNNQNINKNKNIKISFDGIKNNNLNNKKTKIINNNDGAKHIHNVNININNQINIGGKQFHELFSFSDLVRKNNNNKNAYTLIKNNNKNNNIVSRNKNQSLDFNSYITNNKNANSIGSNKINSLTDIPNGSNKNVFKTQYKGNNANSGNSGTIINNKNKKKIRLTNNAIFRSMKMINNKNNHNKI